MRYVLLLALGLALLVAAPANAAQNPLRTTKQAEAFIDKRVYTGTYTCVGRNGTHNDLYRSFNCLVSDWDADTSTVYRLDTRPHGRWHIRTLR